MARGSHCKLVRLDDSTPPAGFNPLRINYTWYCFVRDKDQILPLDCSCYLHVKVIFSLGMKIIHRKIKPVIIYL